MTAPPSLPAPAELEIKLLVPSGAAAALAAHPLLHPPGAAAPKRQRQVTTYFDTPQWDLAHMGASLRIRRRGTARVQTLKLRDPAGQAFARGEWEWPVTADVPDRALLATTPLAALLPAMAPFAAVFATEIDRRLHLLAQDGSGIEVAFDQGRVRAGAAEEPVRELELELKSGEAGPLYRLAAALQAELGLVLGAESKAERGWRLATGRPRAATAAVLPALVPEMAPGEAWRRILHALLANLLGNLPAAMAGEVEGIRLLRAGLRRLRAALALFRPVLTPPPEIEEGLRRLSQVLSEARDWDVFCTETLPAVPEAAALRAAAEAARAASHRTVAEALAGPGLTAAVLGLVAQAEGDAAPGRLADVLPRLEARLARRVRRRGRRLRHRSAAELHALRRALKRLRLGIELMAPLHRRKPVQEFLAASAGLLAELGVLNDAVVAVGLAGRLGEGSALTDWAEARQARSRRRLRRAWRRFKAVGVPG